MARARPIRLSYLLIAAFAAACGGGGGGGGGGNTKALTGTGSLGAIIGATCRIAAANNPNVQLSSAVTDSRGVVNFNLPNNTGPVIVVCTGGAFYDEASDTTKALGSREVRAMVPGTRSSVAITPLTDLVAQFVLGAGATITNDQIDRVAQQVSSYFGVDDLLSPPQVVRNADDLDDFTDSNAGVYAAVLAGLSDIGAARQTGGDAFTALELLRQDFEDQRLGDDNITQAEIDAATNNRAAGTGAAGRAGANQADPQRNRGVVTTTGGGG